MASDSGKSRRRSILRKSTDGTKRIKNITFAETSNKAEDIDESKFLSPNIEMTLLGPCFIPSQPMDKFDLQTISTNPLKSHPNPDYRCLFKEDDSEISVLILGKDVLYKEFQDEFEKHFEQNVKHVKLKCKSVSKPSDDEIFEADFFIFLINLQKFYSISEVRSYLMRVREKVKYLSHRCLFVEIGCTGKSKDEPLPVLDLHNFIMEQQIPSFKFTLVNRERRIYIMRSIILTILENRGVSTSNSVIRWGLSCPITIKDTLP